MNAAREEVAVEASPIDVACDASGACWSNLPFDAPPPEWRSLHLTDVDCNYSSTEPLCLAIGSYETGAEGAEPLVHPVSATWNGSTWSFVPMAAGTGPLNGVSCSTWTFCMAVGDGVAQRWDGSSWANVSLASLPSPPTFHRVSCNIPAWRSRRCVAVGTDGQGKYAATWDDTGWTKLVAPPYPSQPVDQARESTLVDVSCSNHPYKPFDYYHCVFTGYDLWDGRRYEAIADSWDGAAWRSSALPLQGQDSRGSSVSCQPDFCMLVGEHWTGSDQTPDAIESTPLAHLWRPNLGWERTKVRDLAQMGEVSCFQELTPPRLAVCVTTTMQRWDGERWMDMLSLDPEPPQDTLGRAPDQPTARLSAMASVDCFPGFFAYNGPTGFPSYSYGCIGVGDYSEGSSVEPRAQMYKQRITRI